MSRKIEVQGLKELRSALRKAKNKELKKALREANKEAAAEVARYAKSTTTPKRTGRLANSVKPGASQREGYVKAGSARVPYAGVIHFGWRARNIRPRPFLYNAADKRRRQVVKAYRKQLDRIAKEVDKST